MANGIRPKTDSWALTIGLTFAFWTGFVLLAISYAVLRGFAYKAENWPIDLALVLIGTGLSIAMLAPLQWAARQRLPLQMATAALLMMGAALVFETGFKLLMQSFAPGSGFDALGLGDILVGSLYWLSPLALWAAIYLTSIHYLGMRDRERRLATVQIEAHEAQARALRYQVNPHFLYNTLNSIAALILDRRNDRAEKMVLRLADFFRAGLANDPLSDVELSEEIALQLSYLGVEQLRFEDRLQVRTDIPEDLRQVRVPSLVLQPIVENSVRHGALGIGERLVIDISARQENERVSLEVRNNGPFVESGAGTGIGLQNVASRLHSRFGSSANLEIVRLPDAFIVRLIFPIHQP